VEHARVAAAAEFQYLRARGPVASPERLRGLRARRIDSAFEQLFQARIERLLAQAAFVEHQEAERRQVPLVKCERMAQGNGPLVVRLLVDQPEKPLAALA